MKRVRAKTAVREIRKKQAELKKRMKGASPAKKKQLLKKVKKLNVLGNTAVQFFVM